MASRIGEFPWEMTITEQDIKNIEALTELLSIDASDHSTDEDDLHEKYDEMLDECSSCEKCGTKGSNLKETDPTAYRCGFADWTNSEIESDNMFYIDAEYFTEEQVQDLQEAIKDAIDELF